jgi:3-phenylpropionate/trans-cinnamate dioxygenase ferredoxin reductase subunit
MNVNVWDVTDQIEALIRSGRPIDPMRLADTGIALPDLL